jgi:iron(III) transport system permease protein
LSRPLVAVALSAFVLLGLAPLVVMLARIAPADLAQVAEPRVVGLLGRTLVVGLGTAAAALALGLPFGFLVARTDVPGAALLRPLGVLPVLLPPLMLAMTWALLAPGLRGAPATVFVLALSTFPLVGVFSTRAFERIDGRLQDAARLAGGLRAVLRMELPLALPPALTGACLAFTFAVNDFGVPDYVSSVGPKFNVYADQIKLDWDQFHRPGKAVATALPLIALTLLALGPGLSLRRRGALASLGGDFVRADALRLGAWRLPAAAFAWGLVGLAAAAPLGRLLWEAAAMPRQLASLSAPAALAAGARTLAVELGTALDLARADIGRSILYSAATAGVSLFLGLVLGHFLERVASARLGRLLELAVLLPIAAPAILFGIGVVALWNHDATARLYDGGAMAVMLLLGRHASFAVLVMSGAVASLAPALEDAAAVAGARPARRLGSIVAPALRGSLVASFVLVFVFAMRDLDAALLVPAANKTAMLRVFNGVHFGRDSYVAALCLLVVFAIVLPGLLWAFFARRRLEVLP